LPWQPSIFTASTNKNRCGVETASGSLNCCFGSPEHPRYIHQDNIWCRIVAGKPDCGASSVSAVSTQGKHTNTQADAQLVQQAANFQNFADQFVDASKGANLHVWWHSWQRRMSGRRLCLRHVCHGPCSHLNWREHRWLTNHE